MAHGISCGPAGFEERIMRKKVFAIIEVEFEMEDRGYDVSPTELSRELEASVRQGLRGETTQAGLAVAVNHVAVKNWNP